MNTHLDCSLISRIKNPPITTTVYPNKIKKLSEAKEVYYGSCEAGHKIVKHTSTTEIYFSAAIKFLNLDNEMLAEAELDLGFLVNSKSTTIPKSFLIRHFAMIFESAKMEIDFNVTEKMGFPPLDHIDYPNSSIVLDNIEEAFRRLQDANED